jgi:hypothetical protein
MDTANRTCESLRFCGWEKGDHRSHSPDVQSSDFHLFGQLKKRLADERLATDADVKQAVTSWLQTLDTNFSHVWMHAWVQRWDKWWNNNGDLSWGLKCTICYPCAIGTSKSA